MSLLKMRQRTQNSTVIWMTLIEGGQYRLSTGGQRCIWSWMKKKSMVTFRMALMRNNWMPALVFLLKCWDPAMRLLIVFRMLTSLLPSRMSGRDGCSSFVWCSDQCQIFNFPLKIFFLAIHAPSKSGKYDLMWGMQKPAVHGIKDDWRISKGKPASGIP